MLHLVENLQFKADIEFVSESSPCFKSLDYPAKDDFVMSISKDGKIVSRYGSDVWDFYPFGGLKMHFSEYGDVNKKLFKQLMYYVIYSHLFPGKYVSLTLWYFTYQNIFKTCSQHGINVSVINRYPKLIEEISKSSAKNSPSMFGGSVWALDAVLKHQDQIGFALLNAKNIALYKQFDPEYKIGQTPYIPNRIWVMYIQHLDSILDDFEAHQDKLETLYHYLVKSTISNEEKNISHKDLSPFNKYGRADKVFYGGTLEDYLKANGLISLFEKYSKRPLKTHYNTYDSDQFGALLNNVVLSCYLYILYYSIMRKKEALSLRTDCLKIESDERFGDFYLLAGETTKTDPDSDDRWIVPKRVRRAVRIAETLLNWKLQYVSTSNDTSQLIQNLSIWQKNYRASKVRSIGGFETCVAATSHFFFKLDQYKITQKDYDEALALTPSLIRQDWFKVGGTWQFNFHQFRRTLAVNFAINKVSVSSTQFQMKHNTREQQFHYQNNAGRLRLNQSAKQEIVNEYYAEMSRNITAVVHGEAILPHKKSPIKQEVMCFITNGEKKKLLKAQKNSLVGYRKNILGGCMKQGTCKYGGFDSIANCSGGDGGKPCADLIIDGAREQEFKEDKSDYKSQMDDAPMNSPRYRALKAEVQGYETVLKIIKEKKGGAK